MFTNRIDKFSIGGLVQKELRNVYRPTDRILTVPPELQPDRSGPKPVNVASVPQRSPSRYPGGKTWFVPTFRRWISSMDVAPVTLVEPFAGGRNRDSDSLV